MSFDSTADLIEKALIRAFPGQTQAVKALYRFELESWTNEALLRVARLIAASSQYKLLQREFWLDLANASEPLTICETGPAATLPAIDGSTVTGSGGNYFHTAQQIPPTGDPKILRSVWWEFQFPATSGYQGFGLLPGSANIVAAKNPANAEYLLSVQAAALDSIIVRVAGVTQTHSLGNLVAGDFLRISFDGNGEPSVIRYSDRHAQQTLLVLTGVTVPHVGQVAAGFPSGSAQLAQGRWGRTDGNRAFLVSCRRLLENSLLQTGSVEFDNGTQINRVTDAALLTLPRQCATFSWTVSGRELVVSGAEALPSTLIKLRANVVPTVQELPTDLDDDVILAMVEIARERVAQPQVAAYLKQQRQPVAKANETGKA